MKNKVVGIGLSKTGTTTLREVFRVLGFEYVGFDGELTNAVLDGETRSALEVLDPYEAAANFPWALMYREIDAACSNTRFVLTVRRDSQTWLKSLHSQAKKRPNSAYRERIYGCRNLRGHEDRLLKYYENHNQQVRDYFARRPKALLELCWETGAGWHELCEFLEVPIPMAPFPHANRSPLIKKPVFRRMLSTFGKRKSA